MWKEVPRTRKKEVLSSHHVESSRPSLTTVSIPPSMVYRSRSSGVYIYYNFAWSSIQTHFCTLQTSFTTFDQRIANRIEEL